MVDYGLFQGALKLENVLLSIGVQMTWNGVAMLLGTLPR
jgi:hypothetical protein